nr:hypothetical protein HmN_000572300 [Hymenolepis microstoma]
MSLEGGTGYTSETKTVWANRVRMTGGVLALQQDVLICSEVSSTLLDDDFPRAFSQIFEDDETVCSLLSNQSYGLRYNSPVHAVLFSQCSGGSPNIAVFTYMD